MNKEQKKLKDILRLAIVASLYVVLTVSLQFMSYNGIQFRIAEILILLCFYKKDYGIALVVGCLISNFFSPLGLYDVLFGTLATLLSIFGIYSSKKLYIAFIYPVVINGIIVGLELYLILQLPLLINMLSVAFGEAIVMVLGYFVFVRLEKNKQFLKIIGIDERE